MRTIYCDEAGYTGNRLMDEDQPYFAFAGIQIEPAEAEEFVISLKDGRVASSSEFKGGTLCKRPRGQRLVQRVLEHLGSRARVVYFDKRYALCGKMFEYLVEPAISPVNTLLYNINLHRYVANALYCYMVAEKATTQSIFGRFEVALRERTKSQFEAITCGGLMSISADRFPDDLITFALCNRTKLSDEVVTDTRLRAGGWMLELSSTVSHQEQQ